MKATQIKAYGGLAVMTLTDITEPTANAGQVVVAVHAAALNPVDWKIRQGYLAQMMPLQFPATLGGDFSGVVTAVGADVADFKVGDVVYGQAGVLLGGSGSLAEYTVTSADHIARKPSNMDHVGAASLPLAAVSALQALYEHMQLKSGQRILIHGGSGGIGQFAIQLAKQIGATVITTVSTKDMDVVKQLGADQIIDYKTQKFDEVVKDLDAVFDTVGGETYTRSFPILKTGGIIVSMLEQPNQALMDQYKVTALSQFTQVTAERLEQLTVLVEQGVIKTHVDKTFPLTQVVEAFRYAETGHPQGKVVVTVK